MQGYEAIAFLAAFVAFWLAILGGLAHASGWRELSRRFASDRPVEGESFRFAWLAFQSGALPLSYKGCVFATVGREALVLSLVAPFNFMHPRLVIPWAQVAGGRRAKRWFMDVVVVEIRSFGRDLVFRSALGDAVLARCAGSPGRKE
jgi:hypothetical protein